MSRLIVVAGGIAAHYRNGGMAWVFLSWALGFRRLGFDVFFLDQLDRAHCVHPPGEERAYETCLNLAYFGEVVAAFGLANAAAVVGEDGQTLWGPPPNDLRDRLDEADTLVNIAGNLRLDALKRRPRLKVYVDIDPGFTQLWLESARRAPRVDGHDLHFTIGANIGARGSSLPSGGIDWKHTVSPVQLDEWPLSREGDATRFTTVGRWRGTGPHGSLEGIGFRFADKADEFASVLELPQRVPYTFEVALDIEPRDRDGWELLARNGWRVRAANEVAFDPQSFRRYVQRSGAEFSVAKGIYVETKCGWVSDRTTRYLASGKPVLVQDTGLEASFPDREGILFFRTLEEAADGAARIASDYERHSVAARTVAEQVFDSDVVLARFLDEVARSQ